VLNFDLYGQLPQIYNIELQESTPGVKPSGAAAKIYSEAAGSKFWVSKPFNFDLAYTDTLELHKPESQYWRLMRYHGSLSAFLDLYRNSVIVQYNKASISIPINNISCFDLRVSVTRVAPEQPQGVGGNPRDTPLMKFTVSVICSNNLH
jgi:hypothetical protein